MWVVCFFTLFATDLFGIVLPLLCSSASFSELKNPSVFALIFLLLLSFRYFKAKINTQDWINTVLATYDVCSDLHDSPTKTT